VSLVPTMCCFLGAVNSSFMLKGFTPPQHSYISEQGELPSCASHGFAYIRHEGTSFTNDYGLSGSGVSRNDCMNRGAELFELIVGQCSPLPLVLRDCKPGCDESTIYGSCPSCDSDPSDWHFDLLDVDCEPVSYEDGKIVWPDLSSEVSATDFSVWILEQRQALRHGLINFFCECHFDCYGKAPQVKPKILDIRSWCEGRFVGTRIQLAAYIG